MTETIAKTWAITGASSGIGLAVTRQLLEQGNKVIALVRSPQKLQSLKNQYAGQLIIMELNLTQTDKISATIQAAFTAAGSIDVILNAAGYALVGAAEELSEPDITTHIEANLLAPIFIAKAALPFLRAQKRGHIMHISSEGGHITYPSASIYHASKWGAEGFFDALAKEVQALNIAVTLIEPGRIKTGFDNHAQVTDIAIEDYRKTAVGTYFRLLAMGRFPMIGDVEKVATRIIETSQLPKPPLRLVLGSDSYKNITRETQKRLDSFVTQAETAAQTDAEE